MSELKARENKSLAARAAGFVSFIGGALWIYFWDFIRSRPYEWIAAPLPSVSSITLEQILHWGLPTVLVAIGFWLFFITSPRSDELSLVKPLGTGKSASPSSRLSESQKFALSVVVVFAVIVAVGTIVVLSRDGRNLTDREIAFMAARLADNNPPSTTIRISCALDDPEGCEYARRWIAVFDKAGWKHTAITPVKWIVSGVTIYVRDPTVPGYYDLISSFDTLSIRPQVDVSSDVAPNEIQIIIGR
jgi:hypothetical protein